ALEILPHAAAPWPPRVRAETEIFFHGEIDERAARLGHVADAEPHEIFRRPAVDALTGKEHVAARSHHAAHGAQRGGLPGAVGAQDRRDAALFDGEVDAV